MSFTVENLEKNMAKLTIEVAAEEFDAAVERAYQKNKNKLSVPGFRKGKVPRQMIEKMYGAGVFYEDAANDLIPTAYDKTVDECDLEIVSQPKIDVTQCEKGKAFIFTAEVAVKPGVTLGQYMGVEIEAPACDVTDDEVNAEIDKERESLARMIPVEDRAVADGDVATIDFEGFTDGVAFEGGKGEDYELTIGSHSFIDTFEEQLIGKNIGEEVGVNVTFPEEYHAPELAGKPAMFKVTIKGIKVKEVPALDDEFVEEASDEANNVDEYKAEIRKKLEEKKAAEAKSQKEDAVLKAVIENAQMDIPDPMVDSQVQRMAQDFAQRMQMQGLSIQQYLQAFSMTGEAFLESLKPQALNRIQSRLVLEAIAEAEKIEVSDDDFKAEIAEMAKAYGMEADELEGKIGEYEKESIVSDLKVKKALEKTVEAAVEK